MVMQCHPLPNLRVNSNTGKNGGEAWVELRWEGSHRWCDLRWYLPVTYPNRHVFKHIYFSSKAKQFNTEAWEIWFLEPPKGYDGNWLCNYFWHIHGLHILDFCSDILVIVPWLCHSEHVWQHFSLMVSDQGVKVSVIIAFWSCWCCYLNKGL